MDPIVAPARIAKVAILPGSKEQEAWAFGHTHARREGYAQTEQQGQGVFLRYTRSTGWRIEQPLLNEVGRPMNPGISAFALAPNGEGWGVGGSGLIFHKKTKGPWIVHPQAYSVATVDLAGISLKQDASGVYGWAVGPGPTFLRLTGGRWTVDNAAGVRAGAELLGDVVSVAAVDRDNAWAVARGSRELKLYRRTAQGWARQLTGKTLFDTAPSAHSGSGGTPTVNQYASGSAVAESGGVVWVTGSIQPVDGQRYVTQRGPGSDQARPFALRIARDVTFRSYCPPIYQLSSSGVTSTVNLCDQTFPLATGTLPGLAALPGGTVFAGGYGLFRFNGTRWVREPNVAGIVSSVAFHSSTEGWVTSYGNRTGDGFAASTSTTIGHWTTGPPPKSVLRRWPYPSREAMEAVALDPTGTAAALAVGGAGTIARLEPGVGFDLMRSPSEVALHDVAWPSKNLAFAVGEAGTILRYDGRAWAADPASGRLTKSALQSIAFRGPSSGYAVGNKGTILRYDGSRWSKDPSSGKITTARLNAVDFAASDAIAVGDKTTILVNAGRGWTIDRQAPETFKTGQEGQAPNLLSLAGLPDGRAFAGGALSLLLDRPAGGRFVRSAMPILSGSIHTLEAVASRGGGAVRLLAAIGSSGQKIAGPGVIEPQGWLFTGDRNGWRSAGEQRVAATGPEQDAPVRRDAVYDIAVGPHGKGFAAGGFPADLTDDDGHFGSQPSGSIWRLSLDGRPEAPPGLHRLPVRGAPGSTSFAFLGDSACTDGLCSASMGSGTRADEVLARALADVEQVAGRGTVRFIAYGGDMRRLGIPEEAEPMRGLIDALPVPFYAALGDKDLFGGVGSDGGALASNGYFLKAFADRPAPWGHGRAPLGVAPVAAPGETQTADGLARTHYAFDYAPEGRPVLRMIFLDTSRTPFVPAAQNPPGDQTSWLRAVLASAQTAKVPAIVVMHQPLISPFSQAAEAATLTTTLTTGGTAAVLSSHDRVNRSLPAPAAGAPGAFPVWMAGSSGSALGAGWAPERGGYHAWHLVSVPVQGGGAPSVKAIPVIESLVLRAPQGRAIGAGGTLRMGGLGRLPDTGGGHLNGAGGDPAQTRAQYLRFPMPARCSGLLQQEGCMPADVLAPDHRFFCADDRICAFVREDPVRPGVPYRDAQGRLARDEQSGLMCAFQPGRTSVVLQSGSVATQVPVAVGGGSGPCNPRSFPDPVVVPVVPVIAQAPEPQAVPPREKPGTPLLKPKTFEIAAIPALAPPPVQPAPAPPGGGAARKEEREAATESSEMTALPIATRGGAPSPLTGGAVGLAVAAATIALGRRPRPRTRTATAFGTAAASRAVAHARMRIR